MPGFARKPWLAILATLVFSAGGQGASPDRQIAPPAGAAAGVSFTDVTGESGIARASAQFVGGAFFFDLDNDGDLDIFKVNSDLSRLFGQEDQVFENLGGRPLPECLPEDGPPFPGSRDGIGTRVKVTAGGTARSAEKRSSGGYLSQNDPRLLFGLGGSEKADRVEVTWPSGRTQVLEDVPAGKTVTVEEPAR